MKPYYLHRLPFKYLCKGRTPPASYLQPLGQTLTSCEKWWCDAVTYSNIYIIPIIYTGRLSGGTLTLYTQRIQMEWKSNYEIERYRNRLKKTDIFKSVA